MAQGSFSAQIEAMVARTKADMKAIRDESAERLIEVMQEPAASVATVKQAIAKGVGLGKAKASGGRGNSTRAFGPIANPGGGGNLPVDTGFLRASLVLTKGEQPAVKAETPKTRTSRAYDPAQGYLVIENAGLSETITAAYTARYARRVELGFDGQDSLGRTYHQRPRRFVALAAQQWPRIVSEVANEVKGRR